MRKLFPLAIALLCGCSVTVAAATFQTLASYPASSTGADPGGTALVNISGTLYGLTSSGGTYEAGTIYSLDPATGGARTLYSFTGGADGATPRSLIALDGVLYGLVANSADPAKPGNGIVFRFDPATGTETNFYSFPGGAHGSAPSVLLPWNGALYGAAAGGENGDGVIFRLDPAAARESAVYAFVGNYAGAGPRGDLTIIGHDAYGTTVHGGGLSDDGIFFKLDLRTHAFLVLNALSHYLGRNQLNGLAMARVGNTLFETAWSGGANYYGAIAGFDMTTGVETTAYSFTGGADGSHPTGGLTSDGTAIYGMGGGPSGGAGEIFSFAPASNAFSTLFDIPASGGNVWDGVPSSAALLRMDGKFYGVTGPGGAAGSGVAFAFTPATGAFRLLQAFLDVSPDYYSNAGLTAANGTLYGVTPQGGLAGLGSVVRIDPQSGAMTTLYSFTGRGDGFGPATPLLAKGNILTGGTSGTDGFTPSGTLFQVNAQTGAYTRLNLLVSDPYGQDAPNSAITQVGGTFYGTTENPWNGNYGFLYSIPTRPSLKSRVTNLLPVGQDAVGGLTPFHNVLYGTSFSDDCYHGKGQVFAFDPTTSALSTVYAFKGGSDGACPASGVIVLGGKFYGTTMAGGLAGLGTVFEVDPVTGAETILHSFAGGTDGANPESGLAVLDGKLYGTTVAGGESSAGTVFSLDPATSAETPLFSFTGGSDGGSPTDRLAVLGGALYGTTNIGGSANRGTVFRITP